MGEIGIRKDENISKIYHANEKNIKKIVRLDKKEVIYKKPMVGTRTPPTLKPKVLTGDWFKRTFHRL
jgi:hypothetical protein